mgnify:CR=1 FL=1
MNITVPQAGLLAERRILIMIKTIQQRFALSYQGAKDFLRGVVFTTLLDLALMLPAVYVFLFLDDWLKPLLVSGTSPVHGLFYYGLLGFGFMGVMYVIGFFQYNSTYTSVYDESAIRRVSLAEKLRLLPLAFFGEKNLSDLTATIMDDCSDMEHTFSHAVPQLFASLIAILLIAIGMFFYNWQLALALFWVVPVAMALLIFSQRKMRTGNRENYLNKRAVSEAIQEGLDNIQEIKAYNQEANYRQSLTNKIDTYEQALTRNELMLGVLVHGAQSLLKLGIASVIIVGADMLSTSRLDLFVYLVFLVLGSRVYAPIDEVMNNLAALSYLDVRIRRMREMQEMPVQHGTTNFTPDNFDIVFNHVDFSYETGKQVLHDVSFIARQGEITALVGPSGSGKSTAAKLSARFWDIGKGAITLGGIDISQIEPEALLRYFSVVFQDVVLFNASVMDNIRIGRRDATDLFFKGDILGVRDATDEEVLRVAHLAQCDEFVTKMPDGYRTVIGENGNTLSGGERQRISIARALLKDAPIVLLDEATASLDVENETKIQTAISELVRDKTVLIIAHRMRTIANADRIVVLKDGMVTDIGTPDELIRKEGYFKRMIELQMKKE